MKVKFENPSSSGIAHLGRPGVEIPGNGTVEVEFKCSDEKVKALIASLKARFPALKTTIVTAEAAAVEAGGFTPVDGAAATEKMSKDVFLAAATVTAQAAGWNQVVVEGVGTFKVRNDKTGEKSAAELAFAEYIEA